MQTTKSDGARSKRRRDVQRIFEDNGWGLELLDGWDGWELDLLRSILDEEEFQTLLDQLDDGESRD